MHTHMCSNNMHIHVPLFFFQIQVITESITCETEAIQLCCSLQKYIHMIIYLISFLALTPPSYSLTYYVTVSEPDVNFSYLCPVPDTSYCHAIDWYITNAKALFVSGFELVFLSGEHRFTSDSVLLIEDVDNFTVSGQGMSAMKSINDSIQKYNLNVPRTDITYLEPSSRIMCSDNGGSFFSAGLIFCNVSNLFLRNIAIIGCGASISSVPVLADGSFGNARAAVLIWSTHNLIVDTVSVQDSTGFGVLAFGLQGESIVVNSSFVSNGNQLHSDITSGGNFAVMNKGDKFGECLETFVVTSSLFALGFNPYLALETCVSRETKCNSPFNSSSLTHFGAGLTVALKSCSQKSSSLVQVDIKDAVSFGNRACCGANYNVQMWGSKSKKANFSAIRIMSIAGFAYRGGGFLLSFSLLHTEEGSNQSCFGVDECFPFTPSLVISDSVFDNNYANYGSSVNLLLPDLSSEEAVEMKIIGRMTNTNVSNSTGVGAILLEAPQVNTLSESCMIFQFQDCVFRLSNDSVHADNVILSVNRCRFEENKKDAILTRMSKLLIMDSNFTRNEDDCIVCKKTELTMSNCNFLSNLGADSDALEAIDGTSATVIKTNIIQNTYTFFLVNSMMFLGDSNLVQNDGHALVKDSVLDVQDSNFVGNSDSALSVVNSEVSFTGHVSFINNTSQNSGGGIILIVSTMYLIAPTYMEFLGNQASITGGAIYVSASSSVSVSFQASLSLPRPYCFFQINDTSLLSDGNVRMNFAGNMAGYAGSVLYGGQIDACQFYDELLYNETTSGDVFDAIAVYGSNDNSTSVISSEPLKVCPCFELVPDCEFLATLNRTVYPGQRVQISAVTVGQRNSIAPGPVIAYTESNDNVITLLEPLYTERFCTDLNYTIRVKVASNTSSFSSIFLDTTLPRVDLGFNDARPLLNIKILPCPYGFSFDKETSSCSCNQFLTYHGLACDISDQSIIKGASSWVGNFTSSSTTVLAYHAHCPLDNCINAPMRVNVSDLDGQCQQNHGGVLCGGCTGNLSVTLGKSNCRKCSNLYLLLIFPFAIMGVVLVLLLFVLDLTISTGTLGGLIYYVNIIGVQGSLFFPFTSSSGLNGMAKFLSVFVAWMNLDFGIESCFYDGMDVYSKTWFQFMFPAYIFIITLFIILAGRWSYKLSRLYGKNVVSVLATLILLSYTKLLRASVTTMSYTSLEVPQPQDTPYLWLYDGNIFFFEGKHIALFMAGFLVLFLFIVPYTLLIVFSSCLQKKSHLRCFHWVNKVKPFLDAHQGPYKTRFRSWTGILLLARIVLYFVFTFNIHNNPSVNLLAILLVQLVAVLFVGFGFGGIYRKWPLSVLECGYHLNLAMLCAFLLFDRADNDTAHSILLLSTANTNNTAIGNESSGIGSLSPTVVFVGITFILFWGTVLYHAYSRLMMIERVKMFVNDSIFAKLQRRNRRQEVQETAENLGYRDVEQRQHTTTTFAINSPAHVSNGSLENEQEESFSQLREPLMIIDS